jgi:hypothetical protein
MMSTACTAGIRRATATDPFLVAVPIYTACLGSVQWEVLVVDEARRLKQELSYPLDILNNTPTKSEGIV